MLITQLLGLLSACKAKKIIADYENKLLTNLIIGLLVSLLTFTAILLSGSFLYELLLIENFSSLESKAIIVLSTLLLISLILFFHKKGGEKKNCPDFQIEEIIGEFIKGFESRKDKDNGETLNEK